MFLSINENDNRPIYLQIISQVKEQVRSATLRPGDELPSVRELADSLGINMHTVRNAYLKLRDQGIINLRLGRRARVAQLAKPVNKEASETDLQIRLEELITDAILMGITPNDFRNLVNQHLEQLEKKEIKI